MGETGNLKCPECGGLYANARSLGAHRWWKHNVRSAARKRNSEKTAASSAPASKLKQISVQEIFKAIGEELDASRELTASCLIGCGMLMDKVVEQRRVLLRETKALRLKYIQKSGEMLKLKREIEAAAALPAGPDEPPGDSEEDRPPEEGTAHVG